jgi:hypothetical protein
MRRVSIVVMCDACQEDIEEESEGDSVVRIIARGEEKELDLCNECLYGTFLQEARPVTNRKKRKKTKEFSCDECDKAFATERGLNHHRTRMHGEA